MCDCNFFCRILCTIILIIAFLFNTIGGWIGVGDIIPTDKCPLNCGCETTTAEETTEPSTQVSGEYTTAPTSSQVTESTTNNITEPESTAPTTSDTTTTTTQITTTTTTTKPTTSESGPHMQSAEELAMTLFGGNSNDIIRGVDAVSGGGYVACGTTSSIDGDLAGLYENDWLGPFSFVVKFSKAATIDWLVTFGSNSGSVTLEDIAVLSNGNIVVVGNSKAYEYSTTPDADASELTTEAITITLSAENGKVISQKSFGGTGTDLFNCVSTTSTGYVVGGKSDSTDGDFEGLPGSSAIILNLDNSGNVYWKRYLSGSKGGSVEGIDVDDDNNIYFTCFTSSTDGDFAVFEDLMGGYTDTVVIKYDYKGDFLWSYVIATSGRDEFAAVTEDGRGGCVVGGQYENISGSATIDGTLTGTHNCGGIDALLFRIDKDGDIMWKKILSGFYDDYITDVAKIEGGFVVTGYTTSANREFASIGNKGGYDSFVTFLSKTGTTVKTATHSGSKDDIAAGVAASDNGEALIVGRTKSSDETFADKNTYNMFTAYVVRFKVTSV